MEHVFLVGIVVETDDDATEGEAYEDLHSALIPVLQSRNPNSNVIEWWVAEDSRTDGSDNSSAVFVKKGRQYDAIQLLTDKGLAG